MGMDKAISKLLELREALEKATKIPSVKVPELPSPKAPKMPSAPKLDTAAPTMPKQPDLTPGSKKDPSKQAQQIKDPETKDQAMSEAKAKLKLAKNGQWSLDEELVEKGIKSTLAGAAIAGSALFAPMKAGAAPAVPSTPDTTKYQHLDQSATDKSTLNERTYGPYKVTTKLVPRSSMSGNQERKSSSLTHSIELVGKDHSPAHAKAIVNELKGSGVKSEHITGLKTGDSYLANKELQGTAPSAKGVNLWNKDGINDMIKLDKNGQWSLEE